MISGGLEMNHSLKFAIIGRKILGTIPQQITFVWLLDSMSINPFVSNASFLYPLKTSENQKTLRFSDVPKGIENRSIENEWVQINKQTKFNKTNQLKKHILTTDKVIKMGKPFKKTTKLLIFKCKFTIFHSMNG